MPAPVSLPDPRITERDKAAAKRLWRLYAGALADLLDTPPAKKEQQA